jgi:hypothetical protein
MSRPHQMRSSRLCGFGGGHAAAPSHTARAVEGCWSTHRRHSVAPRAVRRARCCAGRNREQKVAPHPSERPLSIRRNAPENDRLAAPEAFAKKGVVCGEVACQVAGPPCRVLLAPPPP